MDQTLLITIERACHELKSGRPIILQQSTHEKLYIAASETLTPACYSLFEKHQPKLVLSQQRLPFLGLEPQTHAVSCTFTKKTFQELPNLLWKITTDTQAIITANEFKAASQLQEIAIQLTILAELLPSVICANSITEPDYSLVTLQVNNLTGFNYSDAQSLYEACRAPLCLEQTPEAEMIAFRSHGSAKEHFAIKIGNPANPPLIRIHSSCYTGDLLNSLTCDCHDQLHSAIQQMTTAGGGIILYLLQEGRNIGLINKLRAYALKDTGLDTVDANFALGFNDDHRDFAVAARMLELLGYQQARLLTNNPNKAKSLSTYGINITECVSHMMLPQTHNEDYLKTKGERLGHRFDK